MNYFDFEFFFILENDVKVMDLQVLVVLEESLRFWCYVGYICEEIKGMEVGVYIGGCSQYQFDFESFVNMCNLIVVGGQNYLVVNVL